MTASKEFIHICNQYKHPSFYVAKFPEKINKNVRKAFRLPKDEQLIAFLDSSILSNGKSGVAFCTSGIFYKWINEKYVMSWEQFDQLDFTLKGNASSIMFENGFEMKLSGSNFEAETFSALLEDIKGWLNEETKKKMLPLDRFTETYPKINISQHNLLAICSNYQNEKKKCFVHPNIPIKMVKTLVKKYAVPAEDMIVLAIDTTIFGSSRQGIAICKSGIYWKNDFTVASWETHLSWEAFLQTDIQLNGKYYIEIGEGNMISLAGARMERYDVWRLLTSLQYELNELNGA